MTTRILIGDCRHVLADLEDASAHCVVTSPPYFGLRDYGVAGQIGLEPTPDAYVAEMVAVFREVRRVLRDDGTVWLNLGDSYGAIGGNTALGLREAQFGKGNAKGHAIDARVAMQSHVIETGLRPKNLLGIPWLVAFALRADGWYLRQDIIWAKPNPMPESVRDRCTKAHEYIFLLSKSARYYYDAEAIKEDGVGRLDRSPPSNGRLSPSGFKAEWLMEPNGRNKRSVWEIASQPFAEAHFATFPPALIEPCILAGCPKGGTVLDPFAGAGTTGLVADRLGRNAVLIELNPDYAAMTERRITDDAGMFSEIL